MLGLPSGRKGFRLLLMGTITVDMDAKCKRCGKGGATASGYCLRCVAKMVQEGKFDHILRKQPGQKINDTEGGICHT